MVKLLIQGGTVVTGDSVKRADIVVENGKVIEIGTKFTDKNAKVINATGKFIFPGGVDIHTHMPWPTGSNVSTDNFFSGTRAAAFGGVTSVIDFAISNKEESLNDTLARKRLESEPNAWVDYSFHINIRGEIQSKMLEIHGLVNAGFPSFKVFMAYEGFKVGDEDLRGIMLAIQDAGGMMTVHAENGLSADLATKKLIENGKCSTMFYPKARPSICEVDAVNKILKLQFETGVPLHIHHVSTAGAVEQIRIAQKSGANVTAETCPHYLAFTDRDYCGDKHLAAQLICAPSIKTLADQQALWEALIDGTLSIVATDHCPYTLSQKEEHLDDFSKIPGGIAGVELRLTLLYNLGFLKGRLSLERIAQVWAETPASMFGLTPQKGLLSKGSDADMVIFDPAPVWAITARELHMNTDHLAYENMIMTGKPISTILRGNVIVEDGRLIGNDPSGELIFRKISQ